MSANAFLPERIGRFHIRSMLGRGAMGVVYLGHDEEIDRLVAIKLIRADLLATDERDSYLSRFRNEAKIAGRCLHANIVGLYDFAMHDDNPYLVMEYVNGVGLQQFYPRGTQRSVAEVTHIALQVLDALHYAHGRSIVHRDIKPANILMMPDTSLKIADFGISRLTSMELTATPLLIGTPSYMSPEQCLGSVLDGRNDLFSLGCVLYELVAGERAFSGANYTETIFAIVNRSHVPLGERRPDLPPGFGAAIDRALSKSPDDRYANAGEFARALDDIARAADLPRTGFPAAIASSRVAGVPARVEPAPEQEDAPATVVTPLAEAWSEVAARAPAGSAGDATPRRAASPGSASPVSAPPGFASPGSASPGSASPGSASRMWAPAVTAPAQPASVEPASGEPGSVEPASVEPGPRVPEQTTHLPAEPAPAEPAAALPKPFHSAPADDRTIAEPVAATPAHDAAAAPTAWPDVTRPDTPVSEPAAPPGTQRPGTPAAAEPPTTELPAPGIGRPELATAWSPATLIPVPDASPPPAPTLDTPAIAPHATGPDAFAPEAPFPEAPAPAVTRPIPPEAPGHADATADHADPDPDATLIQPRHAGIPDPAGDRTRAEPFPTHAIPAHALPSRSAPDTTADDPALRIAPWPFAPERAAVPDAERDRIAACLAAVIGPIAPLLVRRTMVPGITAASLAERLAEYVHHDHERARFLDLVRGGARGREAAGR